MARLHRNLRAQAQRDGDAIAFRCGSNSVTYGELDERSSRLAAAMIDAGVRRGDRVAVRLAPCVESPIAVYAAFKAGAAMVPIDPLAPAARVFELIHEGSIGHMVTATLDALSPAWKVDSPLRTVFGCEPSQDPGGSVRSVSWDEIDAYGPVDGIEGTDDDPAYVIFTSGSTGIPKGIVHTHRSAQAYARLSTETYGVLPSDCIANLSPLHFDMSTFGYFSAVLAGATTVLVPPAYSMLPASLSALIESEHITIWYSVPFALVQLIERGVPQKRDLRSVRWVLYGGEPLSPKHANEIRRHLPMATLSNVYGPAEVNQCTFHHIPPANDGGPATLPDEPIPIGCLWNESSGLILDAKGQIVDGNAPGELLVSSTTMMERYWHSTTDDPASFYFGEGDQRYYRTGDLVRRRTDGLLDYLGRVDRQVKIRGYRIELDEIEHAASSHPAVLEAAAVCVSHRNEKELLLAATVAPSDVDLESELRIHLADRLPPYAVPTEIQIRSAFPRTTSGKIDRRILAEQLGSA
ncbi:MAG: amino acid adenylation domain-containing protein [Planctomycetota bacterium]